MNRHFVGLILFIVIILAAIPLINRLLNRGAEKATPLKTAQTIDLGEHRQLQIVTKAIQPLMHPRIGLYYRVKTPADTEKQADKQANKQANKQPGKQAPAFFGSLPPDQEIPTFVAHVGRDGNLIGIAAASDPDAVLIVHDFATGQSWPRHGLYEDVHQLQARGQKMLKRLNKALPNQTLWLVDAEDIRPLETQINLAAPTTQPALTQPAATQPASVE